MLLGFDRVNLVIIFVSDVSFFWCHAYFLMDDINPLKKDSYPLSHAILKHDILKDCTFYPSFQVIPEFYKYIIVNMDISENSPGTP